MKKEKSFKSIYKSDDIVQTSSSPSCNDDECQARVNRFHQHFFNEEEHFSTKKDQPELDLQKNLKRHYLKSCRTKEIDTIYWINKLFSFSGSFDRK